MENVSKTELKITGIDGVEFYIHPGLSTLDFNDKDNEWRFEMELQRNKVRDHKGKKSERLKMDSGISYHLPGSNVLLASVKLTTLLETKSLKRNEVDEQFWAYLVNTGLAHCRAVFAHKTFGTPLQGKTMPAHANEEIDKKAQKNLNDIWGRQTRR